jgi:hypothetical protein
LLVDETINVAYIRGIMKRLGFVSNSSSSSFILSYQNEDALNRLIDSLEMPEGHPFKDTVTELSETFVQAIKDADDMNTLKKLKYEFGDDVEFTHPELVAKLKEGWKIKVGSFSDEEGGPEATLCNSDIEFEGDGYEFSHYGGY